MGAVMRSSARQNADGQSPPPWTKVELSTFEFTSRPAVGAVVTILPLGDGLAPLGLKVTKVAREMNECTAESFWRADLQPVSRRDFFVAAPLAGRNAESPFDVLLIYPAVKNARLLKAAALNARPPARRD